MKDLLIVLKKIYVNEDNKRPIWINNFQELIEKENFKEENNFEGLFVELFNDLEFYVDDINLRNEDPSYFGEKKLRLLLFNFLLEYIETLKEASSMNNI